MQRAQVESTMLRSVGYDPSTRMLELEFRNGRLYRYGRRVEGWRDAPLGRLYNPVYFNGGIAVHGAGSVPDRPASHGTRGWFSRFEPHRRLSLTHVIDFIPDVETGMPHFLMGMIEGFSVI